MNRAFLAGWSWKVTGQDVPLKTHRMGIVIINNSASADKNVPLAQ